MKASLVLISSAAALCAAVLTGCGGASAQDATFSFSSPDLGADSSGTVGTFDNKFILNGFGCTGGNISPALQWSFAPPGTQSFAIQVHDPDAPTGGAGFWHWAVYNIPANVTSLPQGAGNSAATLPSPAHGGNTDLFDTGLTSGNGNYGGPCPPVGDAPHHYHFTIYALSAPDMEVAAGIPPTGTAGLHGFALNKALGAVVLGKATFTATFGR